MNLILLLDLDDTLLVNDMQTFQTAYLKALGRRLADLVRPDLMVKELLIATQGMIANQDPSITLAEAFDSHFYPAIGIAHQEAQGLIDDFYARIFPTLRSLTHPRDETRRLIQWAGANSVQMSVATNPLFPRTAIEQRLEWAGFRPGEFPFVVVSTYEDFHFAKPNPAYFAEILVQMGCPNVPTLMVGNDFQDDILPVQQLGFSTWWLTNAKSQSEAGIDTLDHQGTFDELLSRLEAGDFDIHKPDLEQPASLIAFLKAVPAGLLTLLKQTDNHKINQRPSDNEWSLAEISCHLRDVDLEVNIPRLSQISRDENPFFPAVITDIWAAERGYNTQDAHQALSDFARNRFQLVNFLEGLTEQEWKRKARHAIFGPTTLREMVGFMLTHDITHVQQFYKTMEPQAAA